MSPLPPRRPLVGGNWKMNTDRATAHTLGGEIAACDVSSAVDVVVFPPFPYLGVVGEAIRGSGTALGAQDLSVTPNGARTGEVSGEMLQDLGVSIVLCGHSERRHLLGETDEAINQKVRRALDCDLRAMLCVGETLEQREAGQTDAIVAGQVEAGFAGVMEPDIALVTIAYEPVWAIGTGVTAQPSDAEAVHIVIRGVINALYGADVAATTVILYGGSVKPGNALELFEQDNIDGGLIGGASLHAADFLQIIDAAATTAGHTGSMHA